jgi:hypothetical protein
MPNFLEHTLRLAAEKKGLTGRRADNFTFGALNNMGAMHGSKITRKGKRMQAKHDADMGKLRSLSSMRTA